MGFLALEYFSPLTALKRVHAQSVPAAREVADLHSRRRAERDRLVYEQLLNLLDSVAGREVDAALADIPEMAEPFVARELSRVLPLGLPTPSLPTCWNCIKCLLVIPNVLLQPTVITRSCFCTPVG